MSRRGNGWKNAAKESIFGSLKKERFAVRHLHAEIWQGLICSIILKIFAAESVVISILMIYLRLKMKRVFFHAGSVCRSPESRLAEALDVMVFEMLSIDETGRDTNSFLFSKDPHALKHFRKAPKLSLIDGPATYRMVDELTEDRFIGSTHGPVSVIAPPWHYS